MSKKQNYAVIGLGRFGYSVAVTLLDMGQNVIAIDRDPEVLERISREGADVFIVNSISRSSLTECGLSDCEAVVIGIGKDIEGSILAALNAKEIGVKRVICKANSDDHAKILEKIGAEIVFPEIDIAKRIAHAVTNSMTEDILPLSDDFSIIQLRVPAIFDGKTVAETGLRQKYGLNLVAVVHEGKASGVITPDTVLHSADSIYLSGANSGIEALQKDI